MHSKARNGFGSQAAGNWESNFGRIKTHLRTFSLHGALFRIYRSGISAVGLDPAPDPDTWIFRTITEAHQPRCPYEILQDRGWYRKRLRSLLKEHSKADFHHIAYSVPNESFCAQKVSENLPTLYFQAVPTHDQIKPE